MQFDSIARSIRAFVNDDAGAVMAEYALVLSGLTISGIIAFQLIGHTANNAVTKNETNLTNTSLVAP